MISFALKWQHFGKMMSFALAYSLLTGILTGLSLGLSFLICKKRINWLQMKRVNQNPPNSPFIECLILCQTLFEATEDGRFNMETHRLSLEAPGGSCTTFCAGRRWWGGLRGLLCGVKCLVLKWWYVINPTYREPRITEEPLSDW